MDFAANKGTVAICNNNGQGELLYSYYTITIHYHNQH